MGQGRSLGSPPPFARRGNENTYRLAYDRNIEKLLAILAREHQRGAERLRRADHRRGCQPACYLDFLFFVASVLLCFIVTNPPFSSVNAMTRAKRVEFKVT